MSDYGDYCYDRRNSYYDYLTARSYAYAAEIEASSRYALANEVSKRCAAIYELNLTFKVGFAKTLAYIGHMNDTLADLVKISKTPIQTTAYNHFEIARQAFQQELYQMCLDELEKAIHGDHASSGYPMEWRFHQMMGVVRLGFPGSDLALVDLAKAEASFLLSGRYGRADCAKEAGRAYLAAGWAAYCQGKMPDALAHTLEATAILSRAGDDSLGETFFQTAKIYMAMNDVQVALPFLAKAIQCGHHYLAKAETDGDFIKHSGQLHVFLDVMGRERYCQAVPQVSAALEEIQFWRKHASEAKDYEPLFRQMEEFLVKGVTCSLTDILAVTQPMEEAMRVIKKIMANAVFLLDSDTTESMLVGESEKYQNDIVIKPSSIFRPALTRTETKIRFAIKMRIFSNRYFNAYGKPLPRPLGAVLTDMVFVRGGSFLMGDLFGDGEEDELPVHEVRLSDFFISRNLVTKGQCLAVLGVGPYIEGKYSKSLGEGASFEASPLEHQHYPAKLTWEEAQKIIETLNAMVGNGIFRLPTEAEWEYAARSGGKKEKWPGTNLEMEWNNAVFTDNLPSFGNIFEDLYGFGRKGTPEQIAEEMTEKKKENGLGLYDMVGRGPQWCQDWYGEYPAGSVENPCGPARGTTRVCRGGYGNGLKPLKWGVGHEELRETAKLLARTTRRDLMDPNMPDPNTNNRRYTCHLRLAMSRGYSME